MGFGYGGVGGGDVEEKWGDEKGGGVEIQGLEWI